MRIHDKMRESERKYRLLADNSNDVIYTMKIPEGTCEYCSPSSIKLFGYTPEMMYQNPMMIRKMIHPDWKEYLETQWKLLLAGNENPTFEYQIIDKYGNPKWLAQNNTFIKNREGKIVQLQGIVRDVSERKQAEYQLMQSQKMEAIGQLAGGIAHDFNNILASILGVAEIMLDMDDSTSEHLEYINMIIHDSHRAGSLTAKLLDFSRKDKIPLETIDIHQIIINSKDILERTLDKKVIIKLNLNATLSVIEGAEFQIQNSFLNIGINAGQAMSDGGKLDFTTHNVFLDEKFCRNQPFDIIPGQYVEIEIKDTGKGILEKNISRIFEPFFTTKPQGKGTGLGLSVVYGSIQNHNGAITVFSEVNIGTIFRVYLPVSKKKNP